MLVALNDLTQNQENSIEQNYNYVVCLLNYATIHTTAVIRYEKNDMITKVHSDASYLSVTKERSRAGGYHYLSDDSEYHPIKCPHP